MFGGFMKFYHINVISCPKSKHKSKSSSTVIFFFFATTISLHLNVRRCYQQSTGGWCHYQRPRGEAGGRGREAAWGSSESRNDTGEHHSRLTRWESASLPLRVSFVKLSLTFHVCCHALFIYAWLFDWMVPFFHWYIKYFFNFFHLFLLVGG